MTEAYKPASGQDAIVGGKIDGTSHFNMTSKRDDVDTADGAALIIADNTTNSLDFITTATTINVNYDETVDGSGTTGATVLVFDYLDSEYKLARGFHLMGSTGQDVTAFTTFGINRVAVVGNGGDRKNNAAITFTSTANDSVQAYIDTGISFSQNGFSHILADRYAVWRYLYFSAVRDSGTAPKIKFRTNIYSRATDTLYESFLMHMDTDVITHKELVDPVGYRVGPSSIAWVTAEVDRNDVSVSSTFSYNLYWEKP